MGHPYAPCCPVKLFPTTFHSPLRLPAQSLQEYGRGLAGGLIFSLPLLFTHEVWQASFLLPPGRLAAYILVTFAVLMVYNRFAGLRDDEASWGECALDSVEEMGLGLLLAAWILWLTGQIEAPMSALEMGGKIVLGGMTVAVGVSVGTAQLGADPSQADDGNPDAQDSGSQQSETQDKTSSGNEFLQQTALAWCGAILIAANIAPTEEVLIVAEEASPFKLLLIAFFSLVLGAYILFFAEFRGASPSANQTVFERARTVVSTYAVALAAAASTLFFFGRFDGEVWTMCAAQVIVVGLAATLGASAGRLLLQSGGG